MLGLSTAGRAVVDSGRGEAHAVLMRISHITGDRTEKMAAVMRGAGLDAMEIAELVRAGYLVVADAPKPAFCERCHRPPTRGTSLCSACRSYLGWAKLLGEDVPDAPSVLPAPAMAVNGSTMHTRRKPR